MDDSEPTRKSGRKRKANKKYSIDAFEGLDLLSTDSEAGAGAQAEEDPGDDEEFAIETVADAAETPEEDDLSVVEGSEASDGSAVATPVEDDGDAMSIDSLGEPAEVIQGGLFSTPQRVGPYQTKASRKSQGVHIRGLPDPTQYAGKGDTLTYLFGTGTEELLNLVRSRDKWASDPTLPTREPNKHGAGGMCHSFSHTEEKRKMEATIGWDWYYNHGGRDKLAKRQKMRHLSLEEGHEYLPRPAKGSQSFLIGPYGKPSLYTLATGKAMSVGDAWKSVAEVSGEEGGGENSRKGRREGWILNIGRKIQCMDWAPNQSGGMQLLALSTPGSASEAQHGHPQAHGEPLKAPAYTASPPTPACIQIWAFSASTVAGREGWLDVSRTPKLQMVVCTEWGDAKQLKWCPMPRDLRDDDGDGNVTLGLLAGIWGDARVRVLDLRIERDWDSPTSYVKFDSAAFEARPPKTLCTCLTWLSSSDLAVGCANGFVAIWSISHPPPSHTDLPTDDPSLLSSSPPIPWFYQYIHPTYILAITSAYPSNPHLLITTSMDGYPRLTDLRAPTTDTVLSTRSRIGPAVLAWCDPLSAAISAEENDFIRVYPLRRFFSSISVARHESFVLSLAVGTAHPFVLAGGADGAVVATNPMRRVLNSKIPQAQQIWFQHEWTRKGGGMVRFIEGFKVESTKLLRTLAGDAKVKDGTVFATIHEEETGVTALAWNPNIVCGGWAAAGMGSGLVRVEDLAL